MMGDRSTAAIAVALVCLMCSPLAAQQPKRPQAADADAAENSAERPSASEARAVRQRVDEVLASRSLDWKKTQLKTMVAQLSARRLASGNHDDMSLLQTLELAQWALGDHGAAKQTVERRYQMLSAQLKAEQVAERAYAEASRYSDRRFASAAIELYRRVVSIAPNHRKAVVADKNIAVILRRKGLFQQAADHYLSLAEKYQKTHPDHARQFHFLAGDSAWRAHDHERATRIFTEVSRKYPGTLEGKDGEHMIKDVAKGERPEDFRRNVRPPRPRETDKGSSPDN